MSQGICGSDSESWRVDVEPANAFHHPLENLIETAWAISDQQLDMKRIAFLLVAIAVVTVAVASMVPSSGSLPCHEGAKAHDYVFTHYAP